MPRAIKPKLGRPAHADPPVFLATNVPESLKKALQALARETGRPMSEHLADAIAGYLWRVRQGGPMRKT
jgi:hypothetical protein